MARSKLALLLLVALLAALCWKTSSPTRQSSTAPKKPGGSAPGKPVIGGRTSPDGKVALTCDLPAKCRKKNIASRGLGCCVFRTQDYCGHYQDEPDLFDLPEKMRDAGIEGGGYPEKVDKIFSKFAPKLQYVQDETGDEGVLQAILNSGRMAGITYNGHDPHYGNQSIAHMVALVCYDRESGWACISDNNFIGADEFVWMSCDELLKRWRGGGGGGWCTCLLSPGPPPVPHN